MVSKLQNTHQAKGQWYSAIEFTNAFVLRLSFGKEPTAVCLHVQVLKGLLKAAILMATTTYSKMIQFKTSKGKKVHG